MTDTNSNPVLIETTLENVNNKENPVLITDFDEVGEIATRGFSLEDVLRSEEFFGTNKPVTLNLDNFQLRFKEIRSAKK